MSEYTRGPWQVVFTDIPHFRGGKHTEVGIFTEWEHPQLKGPLPIIGTSVGIGEKQGDPAVRFTYAGPANARLMAAAPELLEALQMMASVFFDFNGSHGHVETIAMEKAEAAIAKATGAPPTSVEPPCVKEK